MAHVKLLSKTSSALNDYFSAMAQLEQAFKQAGLPASQTTLLAMHLAEIEAESERYQKLIAALRANCVQGANGADDSLVEQLVEVQVALEHIGSHAKAVSRLLSKSIDALDDG